MVTRAGNLIKDGYFRNNGICLLKLKKFLIMVKDKGIAECRISFNEKVHYFI